MKTGAATMPHVDNFNEDELRSLFDMPSNEIGARSNKRSKQKRGSTPARSLEQNSSPVPIPIGDEMVPEMPRDDYANGTHNRRRRHSDAIRYSGSRQSSFDPPVAAAYGCTAPGDSDVPATRHSSSPRPQWMSHFSEPIEIRSENQSAWRSYNSGKTSYSPLARASSFHDQRNSNGMRPNGTHSIEANNTFSRSLSYHGQPHYPSGPTGAGLRNFDWKSSHPGSPFGDDRGNTTQDFSYFPGTGLGGNEEKRGWHGNNPGPAPEATTSKYSADMISSTNNKFHKVRRDNSSPIKAEVDEKEEPSSLFDNIHVESTTICKGQPFPPLRPLSAYNYFFRVERDRIISGTDKKPPEPKSAYERSRSLLMGHWKQDRTKKRSHRKTHGKISFTELSRLISSRWKALPADEQDFYKTVAATDMKRYKKELADANL